MLQPLWLWCGHEAAALALEMCWQWLPSWRASLIFGKRKAGSLVGRIPATPVLPAPLVLQGRESQEEERS